MATGYVWNGFGQYETNDGEKGIMLSYAGVNFWLPFEKVTAIPNWTFREVDHDKSTPPGDQVGELIYMNVIVNGQRIVEELCDKQIPTTNKEMGIFGIEGKLTGRVLSVPCGVTADGTPLTTEIQEREATRAEKEEATQNSKRYREAVIAEYFQSKRERMTGGKGKNFPDARTRIYMEELNVQDLDDISSHQKAQGGLDADLIKLIMEESRKGAEINYEKLREAVDSVRKAGKAQLTNEAGRGNKSLGLAENKAQWLKDHPEEAVTKE